MIKHIILLNNGYKVSYVNNTLDIKHFNKYIPHCKSDKSIQPNAIKNNK